MDARAEVADAIRRYSERDRWGDDTLTSLAQYMTDGYLAVRLGHVPKTLERIDELRFVPESIDWCMEWEPITNTCQLYLHFLEPVKTLTQAFEVTGDASLLELARAITKSWISYSLRDGSCRFTWYDHCAAERAANLMYLGHVYGASGGRDPAFVGEIDAVLESHAHFLADDANYNTQNHGTMMDRSLYLLSHYLDVPAKAAWRSKSLRRLRTALGRDYSDKMVNLENSSSYHLFNFDLYVSLETQILNRFGDSLDANFSSWVSSAVRFLVELAKPDLAFPMIGDGSRASLDSFPRHPSFNEARMVPELRYVLSQGAEGVEPRRLFAPYHAEGYCFMRTAWAPPEGPGSVSYASFRAGKKISNHKHADDLSFTYFSCGRDIFVDSGTYTYQPGEFRRYFMSAMAHNTLVVDGRSYPVVGAPEGAYIAGSRLHDSHYYVDAFNRLYPGVTLRRRFFFLRSGRLVIVDDAASDETHRYSQMFHFSHRLNTRSVNVSKQNVRCHADDIVISVSQVEPCELVVHRGDSGVPQPGIVSEQFNVLHETTALEFLQVGKSTRFITAISADDCSSESRPFGVEPASDCLWVRDGDLKIALPVGS